MLPADTDAKVRRANGTESVVWPNGSRAAIWRQGHGHGLNVNAVAVATPDLPGDLLSDLLISTLTATVRPVHTEPALTGMLAVWHKAYARWYDHDRAGHRIRATAWGWVTDLVARCT